MDTSFSGLNASQAILSTSHINFLCKPAAYEMCNIAKNPHQQRTPIAFHARPASPFSTIASIELIGSWGGGILWVDEGVGRVGLPAAVGVGTASGFGGISSNSSIAS